MHDPFLTVAEPGFPQGGEANAPGGGGQHTILPNFPKRCMKLKECGHTGGRPKFYYVDPPLFEPNGSCNGNRAINLSYEWALTSHSLSLSVAMNSTYPERFVVVR